MISLWLPWFSAKYSELGVTSTGSVSGTGYHGWLWLEFILALVLIAYLAARAAWDTLPVRVPDPGATTATVAVKVTDCPNTDGFGADDTVTAGDLTFLNLARVRDVMNEAEPAELEQTRELAKTVMVYAQTLAFIGSRTDRSLRRPAYSLVYGKVIGTASHQLPLCLPAPVRSPVG